MADTLPNALPPQVQQVLPLLQSLDLKQRISLINLLTNATDISGIDTSVAGDTDTSVSLYEHLLTTKPASFDDDPVEIQRQLRDEWT